MAEFIHSTEAEIKGPFLIDRSQIEALDKILSEEWNRFQEQRRLDIDEEVENEFRAQRKENFYPNLTDEQLRLRARKIAERAHEYRERKEFFIFLKNGPSAKVKDFTTALREPDLQDKEPNGLYVILQSCNRTCEVTLTGRRTTLKVEVSPKRDQFVQQTLMVLKNWQNSVRPPRWQALWLEFKGAQWFVWLFAVLACLVIGQSRNEKAVSLDTSKEAAQLFQTNSLTPELQGRAIQLILAKTHGLQKSNAKSEVPNLLVFLLIAGTAYCIALSFPPDISIAIGAGERQVKFWRGYANFILITTPAFIFSTFMWPRIELFLKGLF